MTKLLTTTTLFLTLLVSPLMAKEIMMKCTPYEGFFEVWKKDIPVYKYKSSFFGDKVFVRKSGEWIPFCTDSIFSVYGENVYGVQTSNKVGFKKSQKEKWASCDFSYLGMELERERLIVDFELGETKVLVKSSKGGLQQWFGSKCERVNF